MIGLHLLRGLRWRTRDSPSSVSGSRGSMILSGGELFHTMGHSTNTMPY